MSTMRMSGGRAVARFVVALLLVGAASVTGAPRPSAAPAQAPTQYTNPVGNNIHANVENPFIVKSGSTYYAYINGFDYSVPHYVFALQSTDLVTWTQVGSVLPSPGAWADGSSGFKVTSPSVLHVPTNPAAQRWVLYYTGVNATTQEKCIGVATASSAAGQFTPNAEPLICGAQDPSAIQLWDNPPYQQLVYKSGNGIYNQVLQPSGLAKAGNEPYLIYSAKPSWWQSGIAERPAVTLVGNSFYLFFSGGQQSTTNRKIGWSPCENGFGVARRCHNQTQLGPWIEGNSSVAAPNGVQVFKEGANQWIVYDGRPGDACNATSCTGRSILRIDKLCFSHDQPRTNAPSTTAQTLARSADCSTDVPGAPLNLAPEDVIDDGTVVPVTLDGNHSGAAGGRSVWTFGDTFTAQCGPASNSGGAGVPYAGSVGPQSVVQNLTPGACDAFPLTQAERDYDATHWVPCEPPQGGTCDMSRIVHWPGGGVAGTLDGGGLLFFAKILHTCRKTSTFDPVSGTYTVTENCWVFQGLGLGAVRVSPADVAAGRIVGDRSPSVSSMACNPSSGGAATGQGCLYDWTADPAAADDFGIGTVDGNVVYLVSPDKRLARVPIDQIESPAAWRYWKGPGPDDYTTTNNLSQAIPVPGMLNYESIAYNPYVDRYLSLNFTVVAAGPDDPMSQLTIQSAPAMSGPWTASSVLADTVDCPGGWFAWTPAFHAELASAGSRRLGLTYFHGGSETCDGALRWATLKLD